MFYWRTGERMRAVLCFMSYFSSSPSPRLSLVDPCISEVIINLTDSIITFPQSALISSPPRRLSPPPSSLSLSPLFVHLSILFLSLCPHCILVPYLLFLQTSHKLISDFILKCSSSILADETERRCLFSALWHRKQGGLKVSSRETHLLSLHTP